MEGNDAFKMCNNFKHFRVLSCTSKLKAWLEQKGFSTA